MVQTDEVKSEEIETTEPEPALKGKKISWAKLRRVDSLNLEAERVSHATSHGSKVWNCLFLAHSKINIVSASPYILWYLLVLSFSLKIISQSAKKLCIMQFEKIKEDGLVQSSFFFFGGKHFKKSLVARILDYFEGNKPKLPIKAKRTRTAEKGLFLQKIYYASHFAVEIDRNYAHRTFSKCSFFFSK